MLKGKNAIITGARGGIGRATVELFAENGINVWACVRREDEAFGRFIAELSGKYGVWIRQVCFDLADEAEIKNAIKSISQEKLPVDILVNNAGIFHGSLLQMTSMQIIRDVFQVNFFSQILIMQQVSRLMMRQKGGSIINVSSVAGLDGYPGCVAYGSSKAALAFVTKSFSKELAPYGIRLNAVAPSLVETDMMELLGSKDREAMINGAAMGRPARPREIAQAILYLASENASFITGQILRVDGGL